MKKFLSALVLFLVFIVPARADQLEVSIDTGGREINLVEGSIALPAGAAIKDFNDGDSIVSVWVEKPRLEDGRLRFAGLIPGGFSGRGRLFNFEADFSNGAAVESLAAAGQVFLNDGEGTAEPLGRQVKVRVAPSSDRSPAEADLEPPEAFTPLVASDPSIFGGKKFVSFATQDKRAGVAYYELAESRRQPVGEAPPEGLEWRRSESPAVLADQSRRSFIYVRAVDRAGNSRLAAVPPAPGALSARLYLGIFAIIIIMTILVWLIRRHKRSALLVFLLVLSAWGQRAQAARLNVSSTQSTVRAGETFTIKILAQSLDQALNAVSGTLAFPADKIQAVAVSKAGSIVDFWATEPTFSNAAGAVNFEGVVLNPGFTGPGGQVASITFRALKPGSASLFFSAASILANDGQGTSILEGTGKQAIVITEATPAPAPKPAATPKPEPAKEPAPESVQPAPSLKVPEIMLGAKYGELAILGYSDYPQAQVLLTFIAEDGAKVFITGQADQDGSFAILVPSALKRGSYGVTAIMIRSDKTNSPPSREIRVRVGNFLTELWDLGWEMKLALLLLVFACAYLLYRRLSARREAREASRKLHESFKSLREDLGQRSAKAKKELDEAERAIGKEIKDIESV